MERPSTLFALPTKTVGRSRPQRHSERVDVADRNDGVVLRRARGAKTASDSNESASNPARKSRARLRTFPIAIKPPLGIARRGPTSCISPVGAVTDEREMIERAHPGTSP